jgi:hypothetical protein
MGSFQITYDDFTGGHYMGDRVNKQPANTWKGSQVVLHPRGDIMPMTSYSDYYTLSLSSINECGIFDCWIVGGTSYTFATYQQIGPTFYPRMIKKAFDDPSSAINSYDPGGARIFQGQVAYDPTNSWFYFAYDGTIAKITTGGTGSNISTALAVATNVNNVAMAGYRLLAWATPFCYNEGNNDSKLYYSDATRTTFATTDYYEFAGSIRAVYPRTNDILVVTNEGVYSMVGVLGQSITIQRLLATNDTAEGMRYAAPIGRSLIFGDSVQEGTIDGNLYELSGATVRSIASFDNDVILDNYNAGDDNLVVQNAGNGRIVAAFRTGHVYVSDINGTWTRLQSVSTNDTGLNRIAISRSSIDARNEYFVIARSDNSTTRISLTRFPMHAPFPIKSGYKWGTTNSNSTTGPTGTVTLSEYWHNKPFVVKEVLAEWLIDDKTKTYVTGTAGVTATVTPLGCVDVTPANVPSLTTSAKTDSVTISTLTTGWPIRVISRLRVDNANKGYGMSLQMSLESCRLRRVVVTCED